jgi:hypothetical protein
LSAELLGYPQKPSNTSFFSSSTLLIFFTAIAQTIEIQCDTRFSQLTTSNTAPLPIQASPSTTRLPQKSIK